MQSFLELCAALSRRLRTRVWTTLVRGRFRSFGAGSIVEPLCALAHPACVEIGARVHIREHAWLNCYPRQDGKPTLTIKDGTYIGRFFHANAWGEIVIEEEVMIADRVYIADVDHKYKDPEASILSQGLEVKGPVRLKRGCWIGTGAAILPGVTVGRNAVVGANTVLHKDVPDYGVALGNPAKVMLRPDAPK
ncbi:MAG: acyltransferase [Elusimicrobia bacterium]|nr:acyltransferase [Elusimicrobiota bacterium]